MKTKLQVVKASQDEKTLFKKNKRVSPNSKLNLVSELKPRSLNFLEKQKRTIKARGGEEGTGSTSVYGFVLFSDHPRWTRNIRRNSSKGVMLLFLILFPKHFFELPNTHQ